MEEWRGGDENSKILFRSLQTWLIGITLLILGGAVIDHSLYQKEYFGLNKFAFLIIFIYPQQKYNNFDNEK